MTRNEVIVKKREGRSARRVEQPAKDFGCGRKTVAVCRGTRLTAGEKCARECSDDVICY